ncbi:hypothetical protein NZJ93_12015 [Desulfofundulus thermocisternus]|nr:hypothetical protein [Desulfofundulus thermocisternus]
MRSKIPFLGGCLERARKNSLQARRRRDLHSLDYWNQLAGPEHLPGAAEFF